MHNIDIISRGRRVVLDALDLEEIRAAGISWLAYCQKRLTVSHCGAIFALLPKREASSTEEKYLIFSQSEAEAATIREGFWSNMIGWTDFAEATYFTATEREATNLPASARSDATWVTASTMEPFFRKMRQYAASNGQLPAPLVPVLFEVDPETSEANGVVMPFCSVTCRSACGTSYPGMRKTSEGTSALSSFGYEPKCEQCGCDIGKALSESQPHRGLVGCYRPDPGMPESLKIVLDVIDQNERTSRPDMGAYPASLPSNTCRPQDGGATTRWT